MMTYLQRRRLRKAARTLLHHTRHVHNMHGDVMQAGDLARLGKAEVMADEALRSNDAAALERAAAALHACLNEVEPRRAFPWVRENLEVAVVAIAVAMAFRAYFLQPFKIPTGSMQPTLYGIHATPTDGPAWFDRGPLKLGRWLLSGGWYVEVRAKTTGYVAGAPVQERRGDVMSHVVYLAGIPHDLPAAEGLRVLPGEYVRKGTVLWSGIRTAGDHVFVDKVRWHFTRPKRGDVIVFNTKGLPTLPPGTFYIKRLAGLPGETLAINPPNLVINGAVVSEPKSIERVAGRHPGYDGYQLVDPRAWGSPFSVLRTPADSVRLQTGEYFALGDNTFNSRDSRYWGPLHERNLVGPAVLLYWPFSPRWLRIR